MSSILIKNVDQNRRTSFTVVSNQRKYSIRNDRFVKGFDTSMLNYQNSVEVKIERGKVTEIHFADELIYKIPDPKAPYNFIPLNQNKRFLEPEIIPNNLYLSQDKGFYSGSIEINAVSKTPVYIRGTIDIQNPNSNSFKSQKGLIQIENYKPFGKLGLPGSSVRGMVRSLVEVVSFGKFGFYNDYNLYFRSFADESISLRNEYNSFFNDEENIKVGLIYKEGKNYKIIPGGNWKSISRENGDKQGFKRIESGKYKIHSGYINGKIHDWEINCKEDKSTNITIPPSDIQDYINDKNRSKDSINLIDEAKTQLFVPCFYFSYSDGKENHFIIGHTRFFRIPYNKRISDCILPEKLTDSSLFDLTDSMFGTLNNPGKLFFDDLELIEGEEEVASVPKILGSPKPTSIQLYLEQADQEIRDLYHYNSEEALIRGNKMYWHKTDTYDWKADDQKSVLNKVKTGQDKQRTIIRPIKRGAKFKGKVRFENLSAIELGALLFVLKLKDNYCHKIGMGKPYGLGSIKIGIELFFSDRKKRYQSLTEEWKGLNSDNNKIDEFTQQFSNAIWEKLNPNHIGKSLWVHPRLGQLRRILDWEKKPLDEKTEYMSLEDFRLRMVLPTPKEIIDADKP